MVLPVLAQAAPVLSDVRFEQKILKEEGLYEASPAASLSFTLAQPEEVTVTVGRHLAGYREHQWPWLENPFPVRTFRLGKLAAGTHTVEWDGLDEKGRPVVEVRNTRPDELERLETKPPTPEQLTTTTPVERFQVRVEAGRERQHVNLERATGTLRPDRKSFPFRSAVVDKQGRFYVSHFGGGQVVRYSPDWIPEAVWPRHRKGQGYDPDETVDVGIDSKGNVFAMTTSGVYRHGADAEGDPSPWPHREDYMRDQPFGHKLGVKTDDPELGKMPGFGRQFSGFAIDDRDQIYLGRREPAPAIMVFDNDGRHLRDLVLPEDRFPAKIRWLGENTLAVTGVGRDPEGILFFLDAQTGAVRKRIDENNPIELWAGPDGSVLAGHGASDVRRYDRKGDPLPFTSGLPHLKGNEIRLYAHEVGLPKGAPGFPRQARAYAIAPDGSFVVSEDPASNDRTLQGEITRYEADGAHAPEEVTVEPGHHKPGNVYFDDEPAVFEIFANNLSETDQPLEVKWTVTDFDGKETRGTSRVTARPLARQSLLFPVDASALGHYTLEADVLREGRRIGHLETQFGRIAARETGENRWSPFAMCGTGESALMAQVGVKSFRGDSASWGRMFEPFSGLFYQEHPEAVQYGHSGPDSLRQWARAHGILPLNGINYGENWLGGDWEGSPRHFLYDYDRFYDYAVKVLDLFGGKGEAFYQFWNEPNFFWHPRDKPFGREHFVVCQKQIWSLVKARDKDALIIADGDAGQVKMMEEFAELGGADWNDTVQIHYPATQAFAWNDMKFPDLPEAKVPVVEQLVAIRDRDFPGKEIWNTEEGIPTNPPSAKTSAINLPRVYIPQMAAGMDKIYWFRCEQDVTGAFDVHGHVFPSYVAYAAMSRVLEGAVFAGKMDLGEGAHGYLFAGGKDFVFAGNTISGTKDITLQAGAPQVAVFDLLGRKRDVVTTAGNLKLTLSPHIQYAILPRTSPGALAIAKDELQKRLKALGLSNATDIPGALADAAKAVATDKAALTRLFYLVKAAEIAGFAGQAPASPSGNPAQEARAAVEKKEGADGYLRATRLVLDWTERLASRAQNDPSAAWALALAARATEHLAAAEAPMFPGVAVSVFIGEPGEIAKVRSIEPVKDKRETSIDDHFRFQIDRKAGESFEAELTVTNYYKHKIEGKVAPRLPEGWTAQEGAQPYALEPGQRARFVFTVDIPKGAKRGVHAVGGATEYNDRSVQEIHPSRVKL